MQELVDWLWDKCVEMYLSILYCLFACCKMIDAVGGGRPWAGGGGGRGGIEDRCTSIQVSALWRCSLCAANVVEMSARISLGSHISVILLTSNLWVGTIYQAELAGVTPPHTPTHRWQWITTCDTHTGRTEVHVGTAAVHGRWQGGANRGFILCRRNKPLMIFLPEEANARSLS